MRTGRRRNEFMSAVISPRLLLILASVIIRAEQIVIGAAGADPD